MPASFPTPHSHENSFSDTCAKGIQGEREERLPSDCMNDVGRENTLPTNLQVTARLPRKSSLFERDRHQSCYSHRVNQLRKSLYWVIEEPDANHGSLKTASRVTAALSLFMILLSLICFVFETMPIFADTSDTLWKAVEVVTTLAFTIEYVLRLWVSDVFGTSVINWLIRPMNICDLLAISPMYIELVVKSSNIQGLRVLRVMRLFKLGRYSQGVQVMSAALTNSLSALYILIFLFFIGVVIFASAVYFTEKLSCPYFEAGGEKGLEDFLDYMQECAVSSDGASVTFGTCCKYMCRGIPSESMDFYNLCEYRWRDSHGLKIGRRLTSAETDWEVHAMHEIQFTSVLTTMWWACVTMTTVGYGDYVPTNWISKLVSSVAMLSGMLIIAMPFAIVGTKFGEAVAIYEDPEVTASHIPRAKTAKAMRSPLEHGSDGKTQQSTSMSLERLAAVQGDIRKSMQLKQQILKLQILRDNLWTSVEHAMAELAFEGITHFQELLIPDENEEEEGDLVEVIGQGFANRVSAFNGPGLLKREEDEVLCKRSLGIFYRQNIIRRFCIWLTRDWPWFDRIVLALIILNSVILALHDYYPQHKNSWKNELDAKTEIVFLVLFTIEFLVKVIAQGFLMERNTYMHDFPWNWLDFLVVVTGWITYGMGDEETDFSFLRTVRVLRPLRTLSAMPGMRDLVNTVFLSLHRLMQDVLIMALFLLTTFGILGLHFWGGLMHRLCRITPQPLHFVQNVLDTSCAGWCFDRSSMVQIDLGNGSSATLNSSLVYEAFCRSGSDTWMSECEEAVIAGRDFWTWPVDTGAGRFCGGAYKCKESDGTGWNFALPSEQIMSQIVLPLGVKSVAGSVETLCGNDFTSDSKYGPQVINPDLKDVSAMDNWAEQIFREEFNWGITRYDHFGSAALVIFQSITLEGWVDIMYMVQDAFTPSFFAFFYFLILLLLGSFFLVNITLAIVWDEFSRMKMKSQNNKDGVVEGDNGGHSGSNSITAEEGIRIAMEENPTAVLMGTDEFNDVEDLPGVKERFSMSGNLFGLLYGRKSLLEVGRLPRRSLKSTTVLLSERHDWRIAECSRIVARSTIFNMFVMVTIAANVIVLAMNRYPRQTINHEISEYLNLVFNTIFIIEFIILHIALNPINFWLDAALAFDGVIVLLSIVDIAIKYAGGAGGVSGVTAIRVFRLLRVFKLAKRFPQMRNLLKAVMETLMQMIDYMFLLFLIIFVFTLIGQSFFGGKFMFDEETGRLITPEEQPTLCPIKEGHGDKPICVPRAHFDTFAWGFITIFQILTGENWNVVMYDGIKAMGWGFCFYFVAVVVFGNFVILNLFLAILMMNFEEAGERMKVQEREKALERQRMKEMLETHRAATFQQIGPNSQAAFSSSNLTLRREPTAASDNSGQGWGMINIDSLKRNSQKAYQRAMSFSRKSGTNDSDAEANMAFENVKREQEQSTTWARQNPVNPESLQGKDSNDLKVENVSDSSNDRKNKAGTISPERGPGHPNQPSPTPDPLSASEAINTVERPAGLAPPRKRTSIGSREDAEIAFNKMNVHARQFLMALNSKSSFKFDQVATDNSEPQKETSMRSRTTAIGLETSGGASMWQRSLFIFNDEEPLRSSCLKLIRHPWFDKVIMYLIAVSSVLMMLSNPLHDPGGTKEVALKWTNLVFTFIFTSEMLIKIVALGLIFNNPTVRRRAYLRSNWNVADGFIVTVSLVDLFRTLTAEDGDAGALSFMKVFRIARLLRPLRLISRNENLKVVVRTIYASIPELRNMVLFASMIFLIWGMVGVSCFKGSFYNCRDNKLDIFEFKTSPSFTPLCVPLVATDANSPNASGMRFVRQKAEGPCLERHGVEMLWQRPTKDTPVCEVRCQSGEAHPFCMNTKPWGYHVMRCTDCQATFCPNSKDRKACEGTCSGHELFCKDEDNNPDNNTKCKDECVAECMCSDYCNGLSDDAALCVEQGGRWVNTDQHFDSILNGWVSLFEISTTEGWVDLMYAATDVTGPMKKPERDNFEVIGMFTFVSFIIAGTFLVMNFCVGVIIGNYHEQIMRTGELDIRPCQQRWVSYQKALYSRKFFFAQTNLNLLSPTRQHLTNIVNSGWFDNAVMACILLNTMVLGAQWYPNPPEPYNEVLERGNLIFALIFNVEAAMKLAAMHMNYFKEVWNVFDFFCVVVSDVFLVVEAAVLKDSGDKGGASIELGTAINTIRIFRIARLFRLVRFLKGLNQLFYAFILSLPKLLNVFGILCLLILLFAVMGVSLFAKVGYFGGAHNEQANFRTIWGAVSVLVRSMTGEGWNFIMHDLSKSRFYYETYLDLPCDDNFAITEKNFGDLDQDNDGMVDNPTECGTWISFVYFISYTLSVTIVVYNLFIAVILDGFDESQQSEVNEIIDTCIEVWKKYDPECLMLLPLERALDYIDEVVDKLCRQSGSGAQEAIPWYQISRWDEQYNGEIERGVHSWAYYNLEYMRMLDLKITDTPDFEVRLIVVLKAVMRRLVIQGGLRYQGLSKKDRRLNLHDLDEFDSITSTDYEPLKNELQKLYALERKQARLLVLNYNMTLLHGRTSQSSLSDPVGKRRHELDERHLPEEVAAAKIQRRIKELLQRRRARYATDSGDSDGRINRAAG